MTGNLILVADVSHLAGAAAPPLKRTRAIGRQPLTFSVLARYPVGVREIRLVLNTIHELLALTGNGTVQVGLMAEALVVE